MNGRVDEQERAENYPKMLDAFPTDWRGGGPWVMGKGTPYAHVMVPVSPIKTASPK